MAASNQQAVITGVTELLPVLRQRAQEAEDSRMVPAESVKALAETGFFRLLQPKSAGGLEADPVTFFTAVRLIASACGSTGWVSSVVGVHSIIPSGAFSADTLGTERAGNGVLIDHGLVLTIGYLITEADTVWLHVGDGRVVHASSPTPVSVPATKGAKMPTTVKLKTRAERERERERQVQAGAPVGPEPIVSAGRVKASVLISMPAIRGGTPGPRAGPPSDGPAVTPGGTMAAMPDMPT